MRPSPVARRLHVCRRPLLALGLALGPGLFLLVVLLAAAAADASPAEASSGELLADEAAWQIRLRLEPPASAEALEVAGQPLRAVRALPAFYAERLYRPAWVVGPQADARAQSLLAALARADLHGLRSADYHLPILRDLHRRHVASPSAGLLGDLDLLLTDALLVYAAHLVSGRVDPATFDAGWQAVRKEVDLVAWATAAAAVERPARALDELLPRDPDYARLRRALAEHRALEPWPLPTPGPTLRAGDEGARIVELRLRLAASGDLPWDDESAEDGAAAALFDAALEEAVRRFQERHGLAADGVVGQKTLDALRVPLAERIVQLEANLERWRWLPRDLGRRHVMVNIPEFSLRVVEEGQVVLAMAAVVGRDHRRTPVMSDRIRYLVLNPFWEVPHKLAVEDKLPEIRRDPAYLLREGFQVLSGWGSDERRIDPATVQWSELGRHHFPYRLRQNPGPRNALGRIKFMFPNRFNVYIHDTPSREVFVRPERALSSGCIRAEKPLELAEYLLRGSEWGRERLEAALATGESRTVPLPETVPVHLEYWTAWVDDGGTVHFRHDVYGRDADLAAALAESPPGVSPAAPETVR